MNIEELNEYERADAFARFLDHVDFDCSPIGCWEWSGKRTRGYGYFSLKEKGFRAHRWIYQLIHGPLPDDLVVRHKCDNPSCVNPRHLTAGTPKDNKRDQIVRGRMPDRAGSKHPMAKLNEADVLAIRKQSAAGQRNRAIADNLNISIKLVGQIVRRETWKHL